VSDIEIPLFSFFKLSEYLIRRRRLIGIGLAAGALALVGFSLWRPAYRAEAAFTPTPAAGNATGGNLAGIAEQLGFHMNALTGGQPLEFYAGLVRSRSLLSQVAVTPYAFARKPGSRDTIHTTLLQLYHPAGVSEAERLLNAVDILRSKTGAELDARSNIVRISVRARWPGLAEVIARRMLELINEFNLHSLQSQAGAERQFVETRLREAQYDLGMAEDSSQAFLERNRTFQASPRLQFESARLQRRVELRQQVYTTLAQAYEQARIAEVRNTPVITVFDAPEGSAKRVRTPLAMSLLGAVLGFFAVLGWLAFAAFLDRERHTSPDEWEGFQAAVGELKTRKRSALIQAKG
jgi:uncharacterized protein involved in exopolysaccharide biosynthesis